MKPKPITIRTGKIEDLSNGGEGFLDHPLFKKMLRAKEQIDDGKVKHVDIPIRISK